MVPKSWKMTIVPRRRGRPLKGVTVTTWCSEWICRMSGGLVHHTIMIPGPTALSLPLLRGPYCRSCTDNISKWLVLYQNRLRLLPCNHSGNRKNFLMKQTFGIPAFICTRHVRVPDLIKFRSILLNFPVPERHAYLSGAWKMKMAKPKVDGTPTVGSISKKWGLYRGHSLVPIHQLPVPGRKLWMRTLTTPVGATHCFLQHLQFYQNPAD